MLRSPEVGKGGVLGMGEVGGGVRRWSWGGEGKARLKS